MKGISFLVDEVGKRKALVLDIAAFGDEIIEDLIDGLEAESRKDEPTRSYEEIRSQLINEGKLESL